MSGRRELCAMCGDPECEIPVSRAFLEAQGAAIAAEISRPPRGVPAYHPTEAQPTRCGGTEA